ncbi:MAG: hydantoinase/oxoprolinase family protein [Gammaproteobacteria bacterium]|nr:hydantoinase/oxoprolinase family protein [Gammaproteobacteria bacterium]
MSSHLLGIDTGGTFTDFVYLHDQQFQVHKVLSTPDAPQEAIFQGLTEMGLDAIAASGELKVVHGTTVATNATLEGKGVPTAYIANRGLGDVLYIGRQTRPELYNLEVRRPSIDLPERLLLEVGARLDANGVEISGFSKNELAELKRRVEKLAPRSIAINLLFSFINDTHEKEIEELFGPEYFVSRSSFVLPEYREYERGVTTWLNAWIGPLIDEYLVSVKQSLRPSTVSVMQSSGVTIGADQAARRAVNLLLSGPVGGLQAAQIISPGSRLITFDMGGTSTDVALIDGEIKLTSESHIANLPIAIPMADIHTIGAGGGSIAFIDDGGLLQVGPASAGAKPGPACYGLGGTMPTVTDANLVLQRLRPDNFLGGSMQLDTNAAMEVMRPLAGQLDINVQELAAGIIDIANEHMTQALRVISIQRGFDPREFTLVCFGGAGGLHFCDLAEALEMNRAIVPVNGGVLSALGMLATSPGREITRTHRKLVSGSSDDDIQRLFATLQAQGELELLEEGVVNPAARYSLDLRYLGQTFTLTTPYRDLRTAEIEFHELHERRYGHRLDKPVELLNLRLHLEVEGTDLKLPPWKKDPGKPSSLDLPGHGTVVVYDRDQLIVDQQFTGPALITEPHATTLIKKNWDVVVDQVGNLMLEKAS